MPEDYLVVHGLEVAYGKKLILRGVDFNVARGEVVALLGANGSGKSTALNAISGFVRPRRGSIRLNGGEIAGLQPHQTFKAGVVQISQARDLFPDLSVEDNVRLGAMMRPETRHDSELQNWVHGIFPRLFERRGQRVRTLSGGEQQMAALARALVSRPKILLLDEPSGGLSPQFVQEIGETMKRLKAEGTTMLLVEQNIHLAFEIADRIVILRDGEVVLGRPVSDYKGDKHEIVRSIYL